MARKSLSYTMYVHRVLSDKQFKAKTNFNGQDVAADVSILIKDLCRTGDMLIKVNDMEIERLNKENRSREGEGARVKKESQKEEDQEESAEEKESVESAGEEESVEGESVKEEEIEATEEKANPSSHHLNRRCVVPRGCNGYEGPNLKRHLKSVHVRKNNILPEDVDRYFAMGMDGRKKRGPPRKTKTGKPLRGRWKRWCPEADCQYLGPYLPEHLQNFHKMKRSSAHYKLCLKVAKRYKGLAGELETMEQPEPAIVEIKNPPSPSSRSPSPSPPASPPSKRARKLGSDDEQESIVPSPPSKRARKPPELESDDDEGENIVPPMPNKRPVSVARARPAPPSAGPPAPPSAAAGKSPLRSPPLPAPPSDQEEDDDDDSEYPLVADFFQEKDPKTNRHKWLVHYYRHLFTPDAGFHKDKNRLQHASQGKRILEETDPGGDDITFIADDEGSKIWIDWVVPNLKTKKPGTVKSYLTSLEIFLTYVTRKGKRNYLPTLDPDVKNELFDLALNLKKWRRCVTKETSSAKWDRYLDESDTLLTTNDVHEIMNSEPAVEGRKALVAADLADDIDDLTLSQYCAARDFLLMTLTRDGGPRPGPLETATLRMFEKAEWDDKKRRKVMLVSSHKRDEDGPEPIPMAPDTEYQMKVFIEKLRPLVHGENNPDSKIFLKRCGAPFHKGTIGRRVTAFIVKSGIRPEKLMSATDFRKWLVTEMKRKKRMGLPVDEQLLRRLMCHSDKTANEWYMRESLREQAAEAAEMIDAYTQPSKPSPKQEEPDCPPDHRQASPSPANSEDLEKPASSSSKTVRSSNSLTPSQIECIKKVFAEDLSHGIEPRKKRVVAQMKTEPTLKAIAYSEPHIKKVLNRVWHLYKNREMTDPYQLPEDSPSVRTASYVLSTSPGPPPRPPSSIESGRVEWSDEETDLIRQALKGWKKVPRNTEIRELFSKSKNLQQILKGNTFERVGNKVKNIIRSMNK